MIRELHGIARARRLGQVDTSETQSVVVVDGSGEIVLSLSACAFPAGLTPDQADLVAGQLIGSARRVRERDAASKEPEKS